MHKLIRRCKPCDCWYTSWCVSYKWHAGDAYVPNTAIVDFKCPKCEIENQITMPHKDYMKALEELMDAMKKKEVGRLLDDE